MYAELRRLQAAGDAGLHSVSGVGGDERQLGALDGREVPEHVVGRVHPAGRPADPDADPHVVAGAQRLADVAQTVVAALATPPLEAERAEGQVELVVHDEHVLGVDGEEAHEARHRATRNVHVRGGLGQHHRRSRQAAGEHPQPGRGRHRVRPVGPPARAGARRQLVEHHLPDVVPVARVGRAGVAESDDQPGALAHYSFSASPPSARPSSCAAEDSPSAAGTASPSSSETSCSMPSSASASASSASTSSAVRAWETLTTIASASVIRLAPSGSSMSAASSRVPASAPSTETVTFSGMCVASTSSSSVWWSTVTTVSGAASPSTCTPTSTWTFSPRRTMTRSTCSIS